MLHNAFIDLFKTFAEEHVDILADSDNNKFIRAYTSEILDGLKVNVEGFIFVLEMEDGKILNDRSDNKLDEKNFAFHIIWAGIRQGDHTKTEAKISECEAIGKQVLGRMEHMKEDLDIIKDFNIQNCEYMPLGIEVYSIGVGCRFQGFFRTNETNIFYDADKWQ